MIQKAKNFLCYFYREILIFFLLFFTLLCQLPEELHGWNSAWYAMDYSLGFDSRLFIGSILRLFYPDFLPAEAVYRFVFLSLLLLLLLLACALGFALRQAEAESAGKGLAILVALYLLSPGSPSYLWTTENMGRFDAYLLLLVLLAAVCCFLIPSVWLQLCLATLAGLIALCIHQAFLFLFFPLIITLYFKAVTGQKGGKAPYLFALAGMVCLAGAALYFQFFSHIQIVSCEELAARLSARTDLAINEVALNYEYFTTTAQSSRELVFNELGERIRYGLVTLFLLSPLAALYGFLWHHIFRSAKKGEKAAYAILLLSHLSFVPAFLLTIDWGRWFGAFLTMQALQIVFLAAKKDAPVFSALRALEKTFYQHPYLFFAAGIWIGSLHKFQATLLPDAPVFFASLYKLYHLIFQF